LGSLCPLHSFIILQGLFLVLPTEPLLPHRFSRHLVLVTQDDLNRVLRSFIFSFCLDPHLSFHAFHRSAASLAQSQGLSFSSIQFQGIWSSDALLTYLDSGARDPAVSLIIFDAFLPPYFILSFLPLSLSFWGWGVLIHIQIKCILYLILIYYIILYYIILYYIILYYIILYYIILYYIILYYIL
jgi:hypothetical protein